MSSLRRRPSALLVLAVLFAGCSSWRTVPGDPADFLREQRPARVRLTLAGDSVVEVVDASVRSDSIIGRIDPARLFRAPGESIFVSIGDVERVQKHVGNTQAWVGAAVLGAFVALIAVAAHGIASW